MWKRKSWYDHYQIGIWAVKNISQKNVIELEVIKFGISQMYGRIQQKKNYAWARVFGMSEGLAYASTIENKLCNKLCCIGTDPKKIMSIQKYENKFYNKKKSTRKKI